MIIFSVASRFSFPGQFVPLFLFKLKLILLLACFLFSGGSRGTSSFLGCSRRGKGSDTLIHSTQFTLSSSFWKLLWAGLEDANSRRQTDKRSGLLSPLFFLFG